MTSKKSISIYPSAALESALTSRVSGRDRSATISRCMERYAEVCARCLPTLTSQEWVFLLEVLGCVKWESGISAAHFMLELRDRSQAVKGRHEINSSVLVDKIKSWTYAECVAVVDAMEIEQIRKENANESA